MYSAKEVKPSTREKISQNVGKVTQPVRQGASNIASKSRQGVDAVKRRGRAGVDIVKSKSSRGVENLRARSKSVPRIRRSTFQVSKVMRDKPLPMSVFGRKKEKKEKCQEDWRNTKGGSSSADHEKLKKRDGSPKKAEEMHRTRSSGSHKERREEENEFARTRSSGSQRRHEDEEIDFSRTRSSGSHRSGRYEDEGSFRRTRSSGSRKSDREYHVEIDDGY